MSDAVSTIDFTGRLTASEFERWSGADSFHARSGEFSTPEDELKTLAYISIIEREYEFLSQSEFIVENFFNLPLVIQQCVQEFANDRADVLVIETFTRLALETPAVDFSKAKIEMAIDAVYLYQDCALEGRSDSYRDVYLSAVFPLLGIYHDRRSIMPFRLILSMLSMLRGVEFVVDLMKRWVAEGVEGSFVDFVAVVENWEDSFAVFPLPWIVNIMKGSV